MNKKTIQISNQTSAQPVPFVLLQDSWLQLFPYGDFPHGKGLQRVDRTAAETLANNFHSFSGKLGRRFAGVPFYVGRVPTPGAFPGESAQKHKRDTIFRQEKTQNIPMNRRIPSKKHEKK